MRRLLVAAAVSLASASEPFSWADAQNEMHSCTNGSKPLVDKYAYLSTRHALGNALSVRRLVEPRRVADRAAATCTEAPARARAAEAPRGSAAETSRP